eukprot:g7167.t1
MKASPTRKKNHLKTSTPKPINVKIPNSPVYTASSTANQQSPDTAAVFSIGVKVGGTKYTVRNSTATSGGILVNLGKIWESFNKCSEKVIDNIDKPGQENSRSGIESFYLGLLLWEKAPEKSVKLFTDAVKQEPGSKLMQSFSTFIKKKYNNKINERPKLSKNFPTKDTIDNKDIVVDELWHYMENSFTIDDFDNNMDENFSFMHKLDFSPFISPKKIYSNVRQFIAFCETNITSRRSPRSTPLRNSPISSPLKSPVRPSIAENSSVGMFNFELNRVQTINNLGLSPSSYKRQLTIEKERQNKKSLCIILGGGEYKLITELLTSLERKDEYSYSAIHLIGTYKKACNKVLSAIAAKHNGAFPCPIYISSNFNHVTQTYDIGLSLFNVDLMSQDFRANCFDWLSKHCHYVILGVFDIPEVLNYKAKSEGNNSDRFTNYCSENKESLLEPARVAHLVQSFEHALQKRNLSFALDLFNSSSSDDDGSNAVGIKRRNEYNNASSPFDKKNHDIKTDHILDLFYKLLISKDVNRNVRSYVNLGRNSPSNYFSLKRWVMDLQSYGFCIEKTEHVYDHWWAPVYLIWGTNSPLSDYMSRNQNVVSTRNLNLVGSDLRRDTTQNRLRV